MRFPIALLITLLAIASTAFGASDNQKKNDIRSALSDITVLREFSQLYPNAFYTLSHQAGRDVIEGRTLLTPFYEIVLRVPVAVSPTGGRPQQTQTAEISLWKLREIKMDNGVPVPSREFPPIDINPSQWLQLVGAKGDFSRIGIKLQAGLIIENLDRYRDHLRKNADVGW